MAKSLQLKTAIWSYLLVFWSATVWAADTDLAKGLEAISFKTILYVFMLSFIGGMAGTLNKICSPDIVVKRVWVEVAKDLFSSLLAGLLVFFLTSWWSTVFWGQAILITLAGAGGSRVVDRMLEGGMFPWLDRVFGKVNKDTP
ncbi:MAG: hypothetical protein NTX28_07575 [Novosphingobium sp.]|nr:hypothetical protein [Novosphingobium sp.]